MSPHFVTSEILIADSTQQMKKRWTQAQSLCLDLKLAKDEHEHNIVRHQQFQHIGRRVLHLEQTLPLPFRFNEPQISLIEESEATTTKDGAAVVWWAAISLALHMMGRELWVEKLCLSLLDL